MTDTDDVLGQTDDRMDASIVDAKKKFATLRTGRASINVLDGIVVDYYGTPTPLNQIAKLSAPEPTMILAQPFDPSILPLMEKAIMSAGLGLNPSNDGNLIRVPIPELSEERRHELVKVAHKYAEQARIAVRNVRRDGMDNLKRLEKDSEISKDEHRAWADDLQKMTDGNVKDIDETLASKEKEVLQV